MIYVNCVINGHFFCFHASVLITTKQTCCLLLLPLWESVIVLCVVVRTLLYVHSSFAIILMGMRGLVALLSLSSWCLVIVGWLFHVVPWVCLQFVIVVFPDHTHLLFLAILYVEVPYLYIIIRQISPLFKQT